MSVSFFPAQNPDLRRGLELFLLSLLALFLELMVIRWAPSVVRLVAYYANLMLISSFLGLGIGAMLGGFCEYLGMVTGTGSLTLLVICAYLPSLLCRVRLGEARGGA